MQVAAFACMSAFLFPTVLLWMIPGSTAKLGAVIHIFGGMLSVMLVRNALVPMTLANSLPLVGCVIAIGLVETETANFAEQAFLGGAVLVLAGYFILTLRTAHLINRELARSRDAALARVETQARFLTTMSHDLRTPLNGILGVAQDLSVTLPGKGAETIRDCARDMAAMVDDLLDNAAIEAGALRINRAPQSLRDLVQRILDRWQAPFVAKRLRLEVILAPDLPDHLILDTLRLTQCLPNLLANALRMTSCAGGGRLDITGYPSGLEAAVTDTGPGLPSGVEDRLFRPFEAIPRPDIEAAAGAEANTSGARAGLGQSICRALAQAMGGDLQFERPAAGGCRFRLTLLAPAAAQDSPRAQGQTGRAPAPLAAPLVSLIGKHILLVDDIATNRLVLRLLLAASGVTYHETCSGAEALQVLADRTLPPPDAVLMDIRMPGLSGFETLARMRRAGLRWPAIAVSADAAPQERAEAVAHGFDGYFTKPTEAEVLRGVLAQVIAKGSDCNPHN